MNMNAAADLIQLIQEDIVELNYNVNELHALLRRTTSPEEFNDLLDEMGIIAKNIAGICENLVNHDE